MESLFLMLLKLTLVGAVAWMLIAVLRGASASFKYMLAVVGLAAMLAVLGVTSSGFQWRLAVLPPPPALDADPVPEARAPRSSPASVSAPAAVEAAVPAESSGWLRLLLGIYAAGAALGLARVGAGMLTVRSVVGCATRLEDGPARRELQRARSALDIAEPVRIAVSAQAAVPATWGVTRPVILLPEAALAWPVDRLRVVFLHELAHWMRRDGLTLLLRRTMTAVLWFHPIAWSLDRAARRQCERACDDVVLGAGTPATDYATHLLTIARTLPSRTSLGGATLAIAHASEFEGRVKAILGEGQRRSPLSWQAFCGIALAAALFAVPLAAVRAVAQPAPPGPTTADEKKVREARADEWHQLGKRYLRTRQYQEAIEAFSNAVRAEPYYATARYNLACAYALAGDRTAALSALREAVRAGFSGGDHIRKDEDLVSIRGSELEAFAQLADQLSLGAKGDNWRAVLPHYEQVARDHPDIPKAWFNLGFVLISVKSANEDRRGIEAFQRALEMGYRPETSMYNLGCAYAHLGERETSLDWLHRAAAAGYDVGGQAAHDRDLDSVRSDPWLASLIAAHGEKEKGKKKKDKQQD
jgi:beta-lactamase regulating signal transducer with metallopeptidase domain